MEGWGMPSRVARFHKRGTSWGLASRTMRGHTTRVCVVWRARSKLQSIASDIEVPNGGRFGAVERVAVQVQGWMRGELSSKADRARKR